MTTLPFSFGDYRADEGAEFFPEVPRCGGSGA